MTRATPLHRADFPLLKELQTRWDDNDVYGHLNNTVHYRLFDSLLTGWMMENDLVDPLRSEVITLVVSTGCNFFAELAFPQTVLGGLRTERIGRTSITYTFGLFGEGETAAAQGHLTHVVVNRATRAPCDIPDTWRQALTRIAPPPHQSNPNHTTPIQQRETIL